MTNTTPAQNSAPRPPAADPGLPKGFLIASDSLASRCHDAVAGLLYMRAQLAQMKGADPLAEDLRDAVIASITFAEMVACDLIEHATGQTTHWQGMP